MRMDLGRGKAHVIIIDIDSIRPILKELIMWSNLNHNEN